MNANEQGGMGQDAPLESWKEIAAYLGRQVKTVQRWEKEERLPVHRHSHKSRSSVYAYPSEIDAWRASRKVVPEPAPARPLWKLPAFALTMLLCLVMVGNGVRPVAAQSATQARQIWANALGGGEDSVSADGRYIVYADWESGNLAVHDLLAGTNRRLTNAGGWAPPATGWAEASTISPDGSQVAYSWYDSSKSFSYEIRILPLQGTQIVAPRTVLKYDQGVIVPFGWSSDAKRLYLERRLADGTAQLAVLSLGDGSIRALKSMGWMAAQARVSSDGRYIAYDPPTGDGAPSSDIAILATDGSSDNVIVEHPSRDFSPMWAPDGHSIVFLSDRTGRTSLWSIPVENGKKAGEPVLLKADAGQVLPKRITDTGALYYEIGGAGGRNVHVAEMDGNLSVTKVPVLLTERFLNSNFHASWSPDGESIAYYSWREGYYRRPLGPLAPEIKTALVVHSPRTGQERDIGLPLQVPAYKINAEPKWFPDGRSVLVTGWVSERAGLGYFRVDLDSGKTTLVHRPEGQGLGPARMDLSPDGKSIYYLDGSLQRFDLDTRRVEEVRKFPLGRAQFKLSPDGKQIAFAYRPGNGPNENDAIYVASLPGGEPRLVSTMKYGGDNDSGNTLAWSSDQKYLLFAQPDESAKPHGTALWKIPVNGGNAEKLGISLAGEFKTPRLSPDGRKLVYEAMTGVPEEIWALENFLPKAPAR